MFSEINIGIRYNGESATREYAKKIEIFNTDVYKVPGLNNQEIKYLWNEEPPL
jgi:hypothetical protein